jgi:hypothetical protein
MLLEERYVNFICENNLTQPQFLLLYLLYKGRKDLILKYKQNFPTDDGTMIGKLWIDDLFRRGFLIKENERMLVTHSFKDLFCNKIDVAEELLLTYPSTLEIDGKIVPLTAIDVITVADLYIEKILDNRLEHEEILKDIRYGITNNLINLSLKKFIQSKYWIGIRKIRNATTDDAHMSKQSNSFG